MALYTIADLHLPLGIDKPMDIFGKAWENYVERLADNWQSVVKAKTTLLFYRVIFRGQRILNRVLKILNICIN